MEHLQEASAMFGVEKNFRLLMQSHPFVSRHFNENFMLLKNCPYEIILQSLYTKLGSYVCNDIKTV